MAWSLQHIGVFWLLGLYACFSEEQWFPSRTSPIYQDALSGQSQLPETTISPCEFHLSFTWPLSVPPLQGLSQLAIVSCVLSLFSQCIIFLEPLYARLWNSRIKTRYLQLLITQGMSQTKHSSRIWPNSNTRIDINRKHWGVISLALPPHQYTKWNISYVSLGELTHMCKYFCKAYKLCDMEIRFNHGRDLRCWAVWKRKTVGIDYEALVIPVKSSHKNTFLLSTTNMDS